MYLCIYRDKKSTFKCQPRTKLNEITNLPFPAKKKVVNKDRIPNTPDL